MGDMTDWLKEVFLPTEPGAPLAAWELLFRLLLALALGAVIALIYRLTQRGDSPAASSFLTTLVLLCILLAMVTQVIGNSAPLAFSLVGILSIVRFRTIVEDTRDTAYVIFAVVVGMATGVGNFSVAFTGLAVVAVAAGLLRFLPANAAVLQDEWVLQLRVSPGAGTATPWDTVLANHCDRVQLVGTATARQGAALDLTYRIRLKAGATPLPFLNDLNRIEGIQNLELKRG